VLNNLVVVLRPLSPFDDSRFWILRAAIAAIAAVTHPATSLPLTLAHILSAQSMSNT